MNPQKRRAGVATLGDASVSREDLQLLEPPNWLNDQLITFWCEHLRLAFLTKGTNLSLILPNIAFFILKCQGLLYNEIPVYRNIRKLH